MNIALFLNDPVCRLFVSVISFLFSPIVTIDILTLVNVINKKYDQSILHFSDDHIWQDYIIMESTASGVGAARFRSPTEACAGSGTEKVPSLL